MDLNLWKNKDDLKKYLDNLGVEYRYGCYEEKNPETCHLLGDYLLSIEKNRSKAAQVYKVNCDEANFGLSCDAHGRMSYRGQGMAAPDYHKALAYFIKGCDLGEPRACYHGGQMLGVRDKLINKVITPDPDRSIQMLEKACLSKKEPSACTLIHSFLLKGFQGRPADMKRAAEYAQIACDQDEYMACYNLSRMYHLGDGVQANQARAKYYKLRATEIKDGIKMNLEAAKNAEPDA